jgi:hypothetical protein
MTTASMAMTANDSNLPSRTPLDSDSDLAKMDDEQFLTLCRRVRTAKESKPADEATPELLDEFERVNREFMRRAGVAWRT